MCFNSMVIWGKYLILLFLDIENLVVLCLIPLMLNPTAMPLPHFLHWQSLLLIRKAENFKCLLCQAHLQLQEAMWASSGVVQWEVCYKERFFFPWLEWEGNWERERPTLPGKEARRSHLSLPAFGYWHERMWHSGAALVICDKTMSLKIRDAKLGRQEVPESSMIAKSLKQPWDYLPPDFLMERKINPWEYLLPLVANVLFFSTSGPQQHSTLLHQSMALWLEMMCDRSVMFCVQWLTPATLSYSDNHGNMYICRAAQDSSSLEW